MNPVELHLQESAQSLWQNSTPRNSQQGQVGTDARVPRSSVTAQMTVWTDRACFASSTAQSLNLGGDPLPNRIGAAARISPATSWLQLHSS